MAPGVLFLLPHAGFEVQGPRAPLLIQRRWRQDGVLDTTSAMRSQPVGSGLAEICHPRLVTRKLSRLSLSLEWEPGAALKRTLLKYWPGLSRRGVRNETRWSRY